MFDWQTQELFEPIARCRRVSRIVVVEKAINRKYLACVGLDIMRPCFQVWRWISELYIVGVESAVPADPPDIQQVRGHEDPFLHVDIVSGRPTDIVILQELARCS